MGKPRKKRSVGEFYDRVNLLEHHLRALIDVCRQQEAENQFDRPLESEYQAVLAAAEQACMLIAQEALTGKGE